MNISKLPFCTVNWSDITPTEHQGETGMALWRTSSLAPSGYAWWSTAPAIWQTTGVSKAICCCVWKASWIQSLEDGRRFTLEPGQSYHVADNAERTSPPPKPVPSCTSWIKACYVKTR